MTNSKESVAAVTTVTTTAQKDEDEDEDAKVAGEKRPSYSSLEPAATTSTALAPGKETSSKARVTVLLPLGNLAVVELEGGNGCASAVRAPSACTTTNLVDSVGDGDDNAGVTPAAENSETERRLLRLEERVEILHCRGEWECGWYSMRW